MHERLKEALMRVEAHARATGALASETLEVGAFTALLPREEGAPAYAVPRMQPDDALGDLHELRRLFEGRGLPLRVELSILGWQELVPALFSAGLAPEEETPLVVCTPDAFAPPAGVSASARWVRADDDLAFVGSVMRQGVELRGGPPTPDEVAGLRAALFGALPTEPALRLALTRREGAPAGTGCSAPRGDTTEISAVSTLPTQRRRGVATATVAFLVGEHLAHGGTLAWACVPDAVAAGLFYKLGFVDAGLRVSWVMQS